METLDKFTKFCDKILKETNSANTIKDRLAAFIRRAEIINKQNEQVVPACINAFIERNKSGLVSPIFNDDEKLNDEWLKKADSCYILCGEGILKPKALQKYKNSQIDINIIYNKICKLRDDKEKECGDDEEKILKTKELVYQELFIFKLFKVCHEYCENQKIKNSIDTNLKSLSLFLTDDTPQEEEEESNNNFNLNGLNIGDMFGGLMKAMTANMPGIPQGQEMNNQMTDMMNKIDLQGLVKKFGNKLEQRKDVMNNNDLSAMLPTLLEVGTDLITDLKPHFDQMMPQPLLTNQQNGTPVSNITSTVTSIEEQH